MRPSCSAALRRLLAVRPRAPSGGSVALTPLWGFVLACVVAFGGDPSPGRVTCEDPVHDFGRVRGGDTVRHEFVLTNTSSEGVVIVSVKSSCGCLAVDDWPRRLEAGVSGTLAVCFDTANYSGQVSERLTVSFADADAPELTLRVAATVWWPIEVTPRAARFEFGANSGTNAHAVVRLVNQEEAPLRLGPPESSHRSLAATLRTNVPGREFELTVRALPPLPRGNLFGQIRLATSSTNVPQVEIPVFAFLQPDVVVTPNTLTLPAGALAEPLRHTVLIHSFWTNTLEVVGASVSDPSVAVRLTPVAPGRRYQLDLIYPAGFRPPALGQPLELRLETNHRRYRSFRVPIRVAATSP